MRVATILDEFSDACFHYEADLVRLTLRIRRNRLHVTGLLNALYKADSTALARRISTSPFGTRSYDHGTRASGSMMLAMPSAPG